jgi:hypothetical protein
MDALKTFMPSNPHPDLAVPRGTSVPGVLMINIKAFPLYNYIIYWMEANGPQLHSPVRVDV